MDNVLTDFNGSVKIPSHEKHLYNHPEIFKPGFFEDLKPMRGALEFVNRMVKSNLYDIYILSQPVSNSPVSYSEKAFWIQRYLPELTDKIILTQDKTLIDGGILIDDNPKWAAFRGEFILFDFNTPESEFERIEKHLKEIF